MKAEVRYSVPRLLKLSLSVILCWVESLPHVFFTHYVSLPVDLVLISTENECVGDAMSPSGVGK